MGARAGARGRKRGPGWVVTDGVGITVPHKDPAAIAAALRKVLTDPRTEGRARETAKRVGASLLWPAVARSYLQLADELTGEALYAVCYGGMMVLRAMVE